MTTKLTESEKSIMNEAFMTGRIYSSKGETETPAQIHEILTRRCKGVKEKLKRERS